MRRLLDVNSALVLVMGIPLAVPAVLLFSTLTLAITLVHAERFQFHSPQLIIRAGTWGGCSSL